MSGTPMINNPVEISYIINLLRGEQLVYSTTISGDPTELREFLISDQNILTSTLSAESSSEYKVEFTLTPPMFMKMKSNEGLLIKIKNYVDDKTKLEYIAKHFRIESKNINKRNNYALPVESNDFDAQFKDKKSNDVFKRRIAGSVSYYSQNDEKQENSKQFATTTTINVDLALTDHQFEQYKIKRAEEMKSEGRQNSNSVYKVYTRAVSNFAFPGKLPRIYPKDLNVYVRNALDKDSAEFVLSNIETPPQKKNESSKKYNKKISELIKKLSEYFDELVTDGKLMETLKNVLSPKFADIYNKIDTEKGISMIYSDFKNVEGIQIMKLILEKQGICELNIIKENDEYRFKKKENCGKYFIHYGSTQDKELNKILLQISNNELEELKKNHKQLFDDIFLNKTFKNKNQVHGEVVKCVLLTKSGSEGISLKNVRSVFIVEPYWNNIRLKQVIGRAVRMDSHKALPPQERTVNIYNYTSVFSEKQKKKIAEEKSRLKNDKGQTTDQMIQGIAKKKTDEIERFEKLLQEASIDCMINSKSKDKCLTKNTEKKDDASMFTFDIKRDAFTISKPVTQVYNGSDEGVVLVKFERDGKRHEYLFAPTSSSDGNLYDTKTGYFKGVMQKQSKTKYKISLKN